MTAWSRRRRDYSAASAAALPPPPRIGVDAGGATVVAAYVAPDGTVAHHHGAMVGRGNRDFVASIVDAVAALRTAHGAQLQDFAEMAGVGGLEVCVGAPGRVADGVMSYAPRLDIERLDLAAALTREWGTRPRVVSDVAALAYGATVTLPDAPASVAALRLESGISAGLVINGKVWAGARGAAGQLSYLRLPPGLDEGAAALWEGSELLEDAAESAALAAVSDDGAAQRVAELLARPVASAVRVLLLTVDVEVVYIGGGLTRAGAPLRAAVARVLEEIHQDHPVASAAFDFSGRVRWLDPADPTGAVGAAHLGGEPEPR